MKAKARPLVACNKYEFIFYWSKLFEHEYLGCLLTLLFTSGYAPWGL